MFAAVEIGGKQYLVYEGAVIKVEKVEAEVGSSIECGRVLGVSDMTPQSSYDSVKVMATVLEHTRTKKVIVFKKKRRHNYRRKKGHRQSITVLKISDIIRS